MNITKVFLLLNGEKPSRLPNFSDYDIICATDGAYSFLKEKDIVPDFISGDFDSLSNLPKDVEVINTPDQNFTDFDKILQILHNKGYRNIDVYGASGNEQDHFLGNLHTALQWQDRLKLVFFDDYSHYFLAEPSVKITGCKNKTISLVPFPVAEGISTRGLQYPLKNESFSFGKRIGTRNKAIENIVEVNFVSGNLIIFVNH